MNINLIFYKSKIKLNNNISWNYGKEDAQDKNLISDRTVLCIVLISSK